MMKHLILSLTFIMSALPAFAQQSAVVNPNVRFNPFPQGGLADQVKALWKKEPDYQDYLKGFGSGMVPDYMIGYYDLNGDKLPEVFARHSDDILGFCDTKGETCRMHIYANVKGKLVEIGRFMSGDVAIAPTSHNGIRDLIISGPGGVKSTYEFSGKAFQKK